MDQSSKPNTAILKRLSSIPEPCIPTQSQVEEERVCRVQVWVVCWERERGVQLVGVTVP